MENFEKDCWYKKIQTDPDMGFYDVFKFDFTNCNTILHHKCFYRLSFNGDIKYYKSGVTLNNDNISKLDSKYIGTLISDHKEIVEEIRIPCGEEIFFNTKPSFNWTKVTPVSSLPKQTFNWNQKTSISEDREEGSKLNEIMYLQSMVKYLNEKIELLKKN